MPQIYKSKATGKSLALLSLSSHLKRVCFFDVIGLVAFLFVGRFLSAEMGNLGYQGG